jgi:hypothetical protein
MKKVEEVEYHATKNERYFIAHFLLSMFSFKGVSVDIKDSTFSFGCYD